MTRSKALPVAGRSPRRFTSKGCFSGALCVCSPVFLPDRPSEHDGLRKDGQPDQRLSSDHGFGSRDKDELKEIAASGGRASGGSQQEQDVEYTE